MIWFGKKKEVEEQKTVTPPPAPEAIAPAPVSVPPPDPVVAPTPSPLSETQPQAAPSVEPKPETALKVPLAEPPPAPEPSAPAPVNKPAQPNKKALYYDLMNALYDAVVVVDDSGHLMDCNERVTAVFGYSRDDTWDMPLSQLVPGINARIFSQMKAGLRGKRRVLVNARCRRKDGTIFPGEVGAGLMELMGESMVISIRNVEKRSPPKAIIRPVTATKNAS